MKALMLLCFCTYKEQNGAGLQSPLTVYGCGSWTLKQDRKNINAFEALCWRRLLTILWIAKETNVSAQYTHSWVKLSYFSHMMQ